MNWFLMILGGLLTGVVAKALLREQKYGIILTTFIGLCGGVIGSYLARQLGWIPDRSLETFAASVGGAIILLVLLRLLRGK